ncbi:MAG: TerB family tellurite resistance protein [Alphaproteobacteria bacterium]|nr:TerB family tellurite resistance protein [Alphaproteobacteria bacterium]
MSSASTYPHDDHPAMYESLEARRTYARLVGAIVTADDVVTADELRAMRDLCRRLALAPSVADEIVDACRRPDSGDMREQLYALRDSDLRFTLLTDMVVLGHADGKYDVTERRQVRALAALMLVRDDQVLAIEQTIADAFGHGTMDDSGPDDDVEDARLAWTAELAARLAAVGVPVSAVAVLAPAGKAPLIALGMGLSTLGAGMGALPGLGVAVGLGVGSFLGVRALYRFAVGQTQDD